MRLFPLIVFLTTLSLGYFAVAHSKLIEPESGELEGGKLEGGKLEGGELENSTPSKVVDGASDSDEDTDIDTGDAPEVERKLSSEIAPEMAPKSALVAVADGSEDIEAVTPTDVLRRAGIEVVVASVHAEAKNGLVKFANGTRVMPDAEIADVKDRQFDVIVLPGGMPGAEHLKNSSELIEMLKKQKADGRWIAAICASPRKVLEENGILGDLKSTGYPAFETKNYSTENVVVSEKIITSRGPGTAMEFSMVIVEKVLSMEDRNSLQSKMLVVVA